LRVSQIPDDYFIFNAGDCSDRLLRLFGPITVTVVHTSSNTRPIHAQHVTDTFIFTKTAGPSGFSKRERD
jgi:hypothetical protein